MAVAVGSNTNGRVLAYEKGEGSTAWTMGYADFKKGVRRNDNPFSTATDPTGKEKFKDWADGWLAARKEVEGKSLVKWLQTVVKSKSNDTRVADAAFHSLNDDWGSPYVTKASMGEGSGAAGGYLLPTEFTNKLLNVIAEKSFIYPRANIIPMGTLNTRCPKIDVETVQAAGTNPLFGGVTFTWGASQTPTEVSEPAFRELTLTAWDLLGFARVSNQWLQDVGPEGEMYLVNLLGAAAAWAAEFAFLQGGGAPSLMPLGILNSPALIAVTRAGAGAIAQADVAKMWRSLHPACVPNAVWACSPTAVEQVCKITGYSANNGNVGPSAGCLYTRPLFLTDKLPALGTVGDLVLFDPSLYVVGNRQEVLVDVSGETPNTFVTNQSDFRVWLRCDGKPQLSGTIRLPDASTVVSAYVAIAA